MYIHKQTSAIPVSFFGNLLIIRFGELGSCVRERTKRKHGYRNNNNIARRWCVVLNKHSVVKYRISIARKPTTAFPNDNRVSP